MSYKIKNQLERNIEILKTLLQESDIYGCDIKIKSWKRESEWIYIKDEQVQMLIDSYKEKLKNL